MICNEEQTNPALDTFMKLPIPVTNKHAPIKKNSHGLPHHHERDEAKGMANNYVCTTDWQTYCKLRNHLTKLNKKKKKLYYETKIHSIKIDSKKL